MSIEKELAKSVMEKVQAAPGRKYRVAAIILGVVFVAGIIFAGWYAWQRIMNTEAKLQQATVLTEKQADDVNVLQNKLKISEGNAQALQVAYEATKNKPATTFYVQAPTLTDAADQVQARINAKDPTLPPVALEKTDRTTVVVNDRQQKVDVLKINLDKARIGTNVLVLTGEDGIEVGAGPSWKNRDNAVNIGATTKKRTYVMGTHYF